MIISVLALSHRMIPLLLKDMEERQLLIIYG